ncbi:MAG: HAD family hydrolase [Deltaproteobacteria bacterium]|nr:HAD family hydrolase [Deltaproteobacteria bacterium]
MDRPNLIVFDMDGVIVDVSNSYRDAVRQTVKLFFEPALKADALPDPLFSLEDLSAVKQAGGLNNDWELTYHVIGLLMRRVDSPQGMPDGEAWGLHAKTIPGCNVADLGRYLSTVDTPLKNLHYNGPVPANHLIRRLSAGDVGSGNVIKQIFQEIYLGRALFKSTYGFSPRVYRGSGLIDREELLLPEAFIGELSALHHLAIATGRPRAEAEHALDRFALQTYFRTMMTLDDCTAAEEKAAAEAGNPVSFSKPHPFMLDAIADGHGRKNGRFFYVGDMPDDMMAAARSAYDYVGIGVTYASPDKTLLGKRLLDAGADRVMSRVADLRDFLLGS